MIVHGPDQFLQHYGAWAGCIISVISKEFTIGRLLQHYKLCKNNDLWFCKSSAVVHAINSWK